MQNLRNLLLSNKENILAKNLFAIALIYVAFSTSFGQTKNNKMTNEILKLEEKFAQAIIKNDVSAVEKILANDWIIVNSDGRVIDRARFLEVMKSSALTHEDMKSEDINVRIYGDTAVVTAITSTKGKYASNEFTTKERATDVFIKRKGEWQ